jgi:AraC family transcriptional regulator
MKPRIETLAEKKLIGKRMIMSFADNKTFELWRSFMPRRREIRSNVGPELYSIEVYAPSYWNNFDPDAEFDPNVEFEKWAAVEVTDSQTIPDGMETLTIPGGRYAVFVHKGPASTGSKTYEYKHEDPNSEEEIWIPIKPK